MIGLFESIVKTIVIDGIIGFFRALFRILGWAGILAFVFIVEGVIIYLVYIEALSMNSVASDYLRIADCHVVSSIGSEVQTTFESTLENMGGNRQRFHDFHVENVDGERIYEDAAYYYSDINSGFAGIYEDEIVIPPGTSQTLFFSVDNEDLDESGRLTIALDSMSKDEGKYQVEY